MPPYDYSKIIKDTSALNVSSEVGAHEEDFAALNSYVDFLISGNTNANKLQGTGFNMGDSYFFPSKLECTVNGQPETRNFYIDNVCGGIGSGDSKGFLDCMIDDIGKLPAEIGGIFAGMAEIGPQKCNMVKKTIITQKPNGKSSKTFETKAIKESFSIFKKTNKEIIPHFYVLTVGGLFMYLIFKIANKI